MRKKPIAPHRVAVLLSLAVLSSCSFSDGLSDAGSTTDSTPSTAAENSGQPAGQPTTAPETPTESETVTETETETATAPVPSESFTLATAGSLGFADLTEASGLAVSRERGPAQQNDELLWAIADSGNQPAVYAMDATGRALVQRPLSVVNRDWEDMAAFSFNGVNYLLVADTGDNLNIHRSYPLHIFVEPDTTDSSEPLRPRVTFNLVYEDGSHNVEALAVAESDGMLYLISKGANPGIFQAPFMARLSEALGAGDTQQSITLNLRATRIGNLQPPQQTSTDLFLGSLSGVNFGAVTAMDIDDRNATAWLLTYRGVYRLTQSGNATWEQILSGQPELITRHSLGQAEALAYSPGTGIVFVTSEGRGAPLLKLVP